MNADDPLARHALNNLLGKMMGAAELALMDVEAPGVRAELELIVRLAKEAALLVAASATPRSDRPGP
ncbi:MAG: hypothetical protein ACOY5Y_20515 [Pseudomonadota bacterium]